MTGVPIGRRELIAGAALTAAAGCAPLAAPVPAPVVPEGTPFYGRIGRMRAVAGERDRLVYLLLAGSAKLPGCLSYIVAKDPTDPDAIWVTEAWESEASHKASLTLPDVRSVIAEARPLIAAFDQSHVTEPVGGPGLRG